MFLMVTQDETIITRLGMKTTTRSNIAKRIRKRSAQMKHKQRTRNLRNLMKPQLLLLLCLLMKYPCNQRSQQFRLLTRMKEGIILRKASLRHRKVTRQTMKVNDVAVFPFS